ncbi:hypothetical protein GF323_00690 [Candidatus Woesearchaeota archaeon]|nr:hypothetical protein [Candidatus Woesearchaeota archaeon]
MKRKNKKRGIRLLMLVPLAVAAAWLLILLIPAEGDALLSPASPSLAKGIVVFMAVWGAVVIIYFTRMK